MNQNEFQEIRMFLEATPDMIARLVGEISEAALKQKPSEKEFSVLEHVCHLRDIEREGYAIRIEKLLGEEAPILPDIDGDKLARERDYNHQQISAALADFAEARKKNVEKIS